MTIHNSDSQIKSGSIHLAQLIEGHPDLDKHIGIISQGRVGLAEQLMKSTHVVHHNISEGGQIPDGFEDRHDYHLNDGDVLDENINSNPYLKFITEKLSQETEAFLKGQLSQEQMRSVENLAKSLLSRLHILKREIEGNMKEVSESILSKFRASIRDGVLGKFWKVASIVVLMVKGTTAFAAPTPHTSHENIPSSHHASFDVSPTLDGGDGDDSKIAQWKPVLDDDGPTPAQIKKMSQSEFKKYVENDPVRSAIYDIVDEQTNELSLRLQILEIPVENLQATLEALNLMKKDHPKAVLHIQTTTSVFDDYERAKSFENDSLNFKTNSRIRVGAHLSESTDTLPSIRDLDKKSVTPHFETVELKVPTFSTTHFADNFYEITEEGKQKVQKDLDGIIQNIKGLTEKEGVHDFKIKLRFEGTCSEITNSPGPDGEMRNWEQLGRARAIFLKGYVLKEMEKQGLTSKNIDVEFTGPGGDNGVDHNPDYKAARKATMSGEVVIQKEVPSNSVPTDLPENFQPETETKFHVSVVTVELTDAAHKPIPVTSGQAKTYRGCGGPG